MRFLFNKEKLTLNEATSLCHSFGIQVYPVRKNNKWYVQVDKGGTKHTYSEVIGGGDKFKAFVDSPTQMKYYEFAKKIQDKYKLKYE